MTDAITYRYAEMETAAGEIEGYAEQYKTAANTFRDEILNAVAPWEGEAKEKFVSFIETAVYEHIHNVIPQIVNATASQIRMGRENMERTDADLAANIPQSLGG